MVAWDKPALGTCPLKRLGHARSWDIPFKMFGTSPLLEHALSNAWDKPALETCPLKCLGHARSWDMPHLHDRNRIASVIMSCGHCCNVSSQTVFAYNTSLRTSNSFALLCAMKGGRQCLPWPYRAQTPRCSPYAWEKRIVENTTGCTPEVPDFH